MAKSVRALLLCAMFADSLGASNLESSFRRQCDMMCETVSEWYESMDMARQSCVSSADCLGLVDHSATGGKYGQCSKASRFSQASKTSQVLSVVCVEYKAISAQGAAGDSVPAGLLQVDEAQRGSRVLKNVASLFTRQCDAICDADNSAGSFETLESAQHACSMNDKCASIVDHTGNKGYFGLCMRGTQVRRGSDTHEVFSRVCVERKA